MILSIKVIKYLQIIDILGWLKLFWKVGCFLFMSRLEFTIMWSLFLFSVDILTIFFLSPGHSLNNGKSQVDKQCKGFLFYFNYNKMKYWGWKNPFSASYSLSITFLKDLSKKNIQFSYKDETINLLNSNTS